MPVARRFGFRNSMLPQLPRAIEEADHLTYVLWDGQYLKVGKTAGAPQLRLNGLATGNPRPLELVAYDATISEWQAHRRLRKHRVRGEWFRPHPDVIQFIQGFLYVDAKVMAKVRASMEVM